MTSNLDTPDGEVSWQVIVRLYQWEESAMTKICPKLTYRHISPSQFDKMNVKLAVQILSRSVSIGIKTVLAYDKYPDNLKDIALSTSKFIEKIDKLFDILNGKPLLKPDSKEIEFLNEMKNYLLKIKSKSGRDNIYCFKGFVLSIQSILDITKDLFLVHHINYINLKKFNQDPLENFFSKIRCRNGNKKNPSLFEFEALFAKVQSIKLLFSSKFSNCNDIDDDNEIINIDWRAVLENDSVQKVEIMDVDDVDQESVDESLELEDIIQMEKCEISDAATKYFAGYCFFKFIKNSNNRCALCTQEMTDASHSNQDLSDILIKLKQYENLNFDLGLIKPSQKFFEICKQNVKIFSDVYSKVPHLCNIKKTIVDHCVKDINKNFPGWFDKGNECYEHHLQILEFLVLVLLRKHCKWSINNSRQNTKKKMNEKVQKLRNVMNL